MTEANCYYGLGVALLKFESAVCQLEASIEAGQKVHYSKATIVTAVLAFNLLRNLDPAFHFNADPDPNPAPHQSQTNLRPLFYRPSRAPI